MRRSRAPDHRDRAIDSPSWAFRSNPAPILAAAARGQSVGRPHAGHVVAGGGHVQTREDAFRRFLEQGGPAYVPRQGVSPEEVIAVIHQSRGLAWVAHPGVSRTDGRLADLAKAGLDAIEVRHPDHDAETEARIAASRAGSSCW